LVVEVVVVTVVEVVEVIEQPLESLSQQAMI
jgi:hypothetical protein